MALGYLIQLLRLFLAPKTELTTEMALNLTDKLKRALANDDEFPDTVRIYRELLKLYGD